MGQNLIMQLMDEIERFINTQTAAFFWWEESNQLIVCIRSHSAPHRSASLYFFLFALLQGFGHDGSFSRKARSPGKPIRTFRPSIPTRFRPSGRSSHRLPFLIRTNMDTHPSRPRSRPQTQSSLLSDKVADWFHSFADNSVNRWSCRRSPRSNRLPLIAFIWNRLRLTTPLYGHPVRTPMDRRIKKWTLIEFFKCFMDKTTWS